MTPAQSPSSSINVGTGFLSDLSLLGSVSCFSSSSGRGNLFSGGAGSAPGWGFPEGYWSTEIWSLYMVGSLFNPLFASLLGTLLGLVV